jgi:hypothetical protein
MAYVDSTPRQAFLKVPKVQADAHIRPARVADASHREPVVVPGPARCHDASSPSVACCRHTAQGGRLPAIREAAAEGV